MPNPMESGFQFYFMLRNPTVLHSYFLGIVNYESKW